MCTLTFLKSFSVFSTTYLIQEVDNSTINVDKEIIRKEKKKKSEMVLQRKGYVCACVCV